MSSGRIASVDAGVSITLGNKVYGCFCFLHFGIMIVKHVHHCLQQRVMQTREKGKIS